MKKIYVVSGLGDGVTGTFGNKKAAMSHIRSYLMDQKPEFVSQTDDEWVYKSRFATAKLQLFYLNQH